MTKYKGHIAVVGAGYWGQKLIRNFYELGSLRTICDTNPSVIKPLSEKYPDINGVTDPVSVRDDDHILAVVVAAPSSAHFGLAKDFLLAGKDIFVEKPLSLRSEEGYELIRIAEENKRILMVGHLLQYHPVVLKLKEIIDRGDLGKVNYIYSTRLNLGKIRKEENILWSFAPHDISLILYLLNEIPSEISSHGGNYLQPHIADVTMTILTFPSGVKSHIFVSWLHPYKEQKFVVVGEKKMAVFNDTLAAEKLLIYPHRIEWIHRQPVPSPKGAEIIPYAQTEPLKEECLHFIQCVETRQTPKTDGREGVRVLEVLEVCQQSLDRGGEVVKPGGKPQKRFFAHATCTIDEPSNIEEGTKIWHYSHVMKGATIGKNCTIGQNVLIGQDVTVGNNVKIQNNVSVYMGVTLEDDVFCGPSMVFTNVINPRSHVPRKHEFQPTMVKRGATIGANATILCGTTIGEYAFVGAGSVVTKNVPAYALVYGNAATIKGWICRCGVKLANTKQAHRLKCPSCALTYKKGSKGVFPIS